MILTSTGPDAGEIADDGRPEVSILLRILVAVLVLTVRGSTDGNRGGHLDALVQRHGCSKSEESGVHLEEWRSLDNRLLFVWKMRESSKGDF